MNSINRLEVKWTPQWDLGLQSSFGFLDENKSAEVEDQVGDSAKTMSLAATEVLNRQSAPSNRLDEGPYSVGALIDIFRMDDSGKEKSL